MNLKEKSIRAWTVFCKAFSVLLFVGLLAGVAWGDNSVCLSCHRDSMPHLFKVEKTADKSHPEKAFVRQHTLSKNFAKEKIHASQSITEADFGKNVVGWAKIIYIVLIGSAIGGVILLFLCF